jgi:hypothetical protein
MEKAEATRMFWAAMGTIYIGGIVLYFAGVKPRSGVASEIIPVSEPTAIDWAQVGGIMFLT